VILLNPNVGVAPGTTTMQLGECPPDPVARYTAMPVVQTSAVVDESASGPHSTLYYPYAEMERLRGLHGLGMIAPRWGLIAFAGLAIFAGVLGYRRFRR